MSFFNFSSDVTKSTVLQFLKFSFVLPAMNESVNESIQNNKKQINIKLTKNRVVHKLKGVFSKIIFSQLYVDKLM